MKILVTGGCGFIGSTVVRMALAEGHTVRNLDALTYAGRLETLSDVKDNPRYTFAKIDIRFPEAVTAAVKNFAPGGIVHLAAESHVDRSINAPGDFMSTNILGTYNLLQAARALRDSGQALRFLHVSTDEVFGDLGPSDPAFNEETRYAPSSPYAASKAASDHIVRAWGRTYGLDTVITNCSNNFGPYQFPEKLIPVVILKAMRGENIPVYGTGENIRDWLYVDDHARGLLTALTQGQSGETYCFGAHNPVTNIDLVGKICAIMDGIFPGKAPHSNLISFVTDRPGHDYRYEINASKAQADLDWAPASSFDAALENTVQWYLENTDWWTPLLAGTERQGQL